MPKPATALLCITLLPHSVMATELPTIIFTDDGVHLSSDPKQQADMGENLSLMDLGRRFPSYLVTSSYYSGDEEGILTTIACDDASVSFAHDEAIVGEFRTTDENAAFENNVQVGMSVVDAVGVTAFCNLCTEDEMPYCKPSPKSLERYDIAYDYEKCAPISGQADDRCWGTYRLQACVKVHGLGHASTDELMNR